MKRKREKLVSLAIAVTLIFFISGFKTLETSETVTNTSDKEIFSSGEEFQLQPAKQKVTGQPRKIIDLLPLAGAETTQWTNGNVWLDFPGEETDSRGFACYRENIELEDGSVHTKVLETHPEWRDEHGLIVGIFKIAKLPANATFRSQIGFLKGATQTDGVKFRVYAKKDPTFDAAAWCYYDGQLDDIGIYLDRYAGQEVELVLEVHVYHTSAQDWAAWVSPRIEWE